MRVIKYTNMYFTNITIPKLICDINDIYILKKMIY